MTSRVLAGLEVSGLVLWSGQGEQALNAEDTNAGSFALVESACLARKASGRCCQSKAWDNSTESLDIKRNRLQGKESLQSVARKKPDLGKKTSDDPR